MRYNRKFLFCLLALVFLLACTQTQTPEQRAKDATVLIIARYANGSIGNGTGFFVQPDKIATNIHIVDSVRIVFAVGTKKIYNIEKVTGYDPERDLVVLKVSGEGKPLELGEGEIGDPIFAVGYPDGGYTHTEGTVHGIRKSDGQLRLVTRGFPENRDSVLAHGNSGGPVLNSEGQVIGIAVTGGEDFNGAIASSALNPWLDLSNEEENEEDLSDWQLKDPILAFGYSRWGNKKLESHYYDLAIKGFDKAVTSYPKAKDYHQRGNAKYKLGSYQLAIQDYDEAIKLIPDDVLFHYNRGVVKLENGDYAEAIADFDQVLELNSDYVAAYNGRGNAKIEMSKPDYRGAIQDYTKAINRNPKDPWNYYYNRGNAKLKSEDYGGQLIEDYGKAIELKADFVNAYLSRGIAKAEMPSPDHAGAIEDYKKVIELDEENGDAYHKRGIAKKALGQDEDAKQDYAKAYYHWGNADFSNYKYQAAIKKFDETIKLVQNRPEPYYNRGLTYHRLIGEKVTIKKRLRTMIRQLRSMMMQ